METIETEYQWIVKNSEFSIKNHRERVSSPIFSFKSIRECNWRLDFYPQGNTESTKNQFAVFLKSLNDFSIEVFFNISLSNCKTNQILVAGVGQQTFPPNLVGNGFSSPVNYDLVANDDVKIVCKINTQGDRPRLKAKNDEMELELLESQRRLEEFDKFGELFYSGAFSDVIIKVNEKEFKVHKNILASKSSVFNAMLSSDVKENLENIIEIVDIDSAVIEEVLYFMYTGKVHQTSIDMKMKIFIAADKYFVDGLKKICIQQLSKNITVNNVLEILDFARSYDHKELHNDCITFIGKHTVDLLK